MKEATKAEVIRLLNSAHRGQKFSECKGEIFSSGSSALASGTYYIAGLNPMGGDGYRSISEHVRDWDLIEYSAFEQQCWHLDCWNQDAYGLQGGRKPEICGHSKSRHQNAIQEMAKRLGIELKSVFATNAIFAKSIGATTFKGETKFSLREAFDICWPVHQYFLSIVKPKLILCLGYDHSKSAFSFFCRKANLRSKVEVFKNIESHKYVDYKWASAEFNLGADGTKILECVIVGIRHPSYVPDATKNKHFPALISGFVRS